MKKRLLLFGCLLFGIASWSQLKSTTSCPPFVVDILDGKVNEIRSTATVGQIKEKFPCFTKAEVESNIAKCGGGVFYKDKDIYFYTARDYVEIGPAFKGKLTLPLMGASRSSLFKWLGNPKIKDKNWDAFTTAYGVLILNYTSAGKVNKIRFSTMTTETIQLCE